MLDGIAQGQTSIVRGGPDRMAMINANRQDPDAVDRTLAARKPALERAVESHSSL
jgi:hypothetical protein